MIVRGKITLLVDGIAIRRLRYENKEQRKQIIKEWQGYKLGDVSYSILPDPYEPEITVREVIRRWDFQPYEKPKFIPEEWSRPPATYSNKGYQSILDKYL